jgi:Protein of unknown function (DUF2490)
MCLGLCPAAFAAPQDLQGWTPISLEAPVPRLAKMRVSLELQPRFTDNIGSFALLRVRPSVTWQVNDHWSLTAGYLWSPVFPATGPVEFENRLWQQTQLNHHLKRLHLTHQLRLEQRFVNRDTSVRGRYLLRVVGPIKQTPWRWVGSHEILVNLNDTPSLPAGLNQNRTFVGLRRVLGHSRFAEGGYLLQWVNSPPQAHNHVLVLRLQWTLAQPKQEDDLELSPY